MITPPRFTRSLLVLIASLILVQTARAQFLMQPNDSLAICGDSITEQRIYTVFMEDYLLMCQPTTGQKITQFGWSGERAPGFLARLDTDVFPFKPTIATTCYGMNDGGYKALDDATAATYRTSQTGIVDAMKKAGVRTIIIGSAKCVDTTAYHRDAGADVYNKTLGSLAQIDQDIAKQEGIVYADVFGATTSAMEKGKAAMGSSYILGGNDGVHPGANGHLVMAYAFLKALGCDGAIGTITVDMASGKTEGSDGQKIQSFVNGNVNVESTRYPFCVPGNPVAMDQNAASVLKFVPFNEDLNRYVLVVKGLKTPYGKVTWGKTSMTFPAADLEKGVNLAAEFQQDNPFFEQFTKVDAAVKLQQVQETFLSKVFMHTLKSFKDMAPDQAAQLDQVQAGGMTQHEKLFAAAASLVVPVQHTIKIEGSTEAPAPPAPAAAPSAPPAAKT